MSIALKNRALVSVTNKSQLEEFKRLFAAGWQFVSTGNTAKELSRLGIPSIPVGQVTGFPEMMDGRLKTLHPNIFGGILADQHNPEHMKAIVEHGIDCFGIVAVNLYDFSKNPGIENIDIGGPSLLRAAAKNHTSIAGICDPEDYSWVIDEILEDEDRLSIDTLESLAVKTFEHTAEYDGMIVDWMNVQRDKGIRLRDLSAVSPH
jgi:phosphoribosylaminoimidazolecarboxamide formyltransferase/IMP cyclohydrolase